MHPNRGGADQIHAALAGDVLRFGVEIVDHLHVVGHETDGHDHYVGAAIHFAKHVANVGLEPRLAGRSTAALINQAPIANAQTLGDQPARFVKLLLLIAGVGHR
jgi:hypothetical protein